MLKIFIFLMINSLLVSCRKADNDFNPSVYDCGNSINPEAYLPARPVMDPGSYKRLKSGSLLVNRIDRSGIESPYPVFTKKNCLQVPKDGSWLIVSKESQAFIVESGATGVDTSFIQLKPPIQTSIKLNCSSQKKWSLEKSIGDVLSISHIRYFKLNYEILDSDQQLKLKRDIYEIDRLVFDDSFEEGTYKFQVNYIDLFDGRKKKQRQECTFTFDKTPPNIYLKFDEAQPANVIKKFDKIEYLGRKVYQVPVEYSLDFKDIDQKTENLAQEYTIEFCFIPQNDFVQEQFVDRNCLPDEVKVYQGPFNVPNSKGLWLLKYRVKDQAGNMMNFGENTLWSHGTALMIYNKNTIELARSIAKEIRFLELKNPTLASVEMVKKALEITRLRSELGTQFEQRQLEYPSIASLVKNLRKPTRLILDLEMPESISAFTASDDHHYLLAGSDSGSVYIVNTRDNSRTDIENVHERRVRSLVISQSKSFFLTGGVDGKILYWDFTDLSRPREIVSAQGSVKDLRLFSEDKIVVAVTGRALQAWDISTDKLLWRVEDVSLRPDIAVGKHGDEVAVFTSSSVLQVFKVQNGSLLKEVEIPNSISPHILGLIDGGRRALLLCEDSYLCSVDLETSDVFNLLRDQDLQALSSSMSQDKRFVASASIDGHVLVVDLQRKAVVSKYHFSDGVMFHPHFSAKTGDLAFGGESGRIRIISPTGQTIQKTQLNNSELGSVLTNQTPLHLTLSPTGNVSKYNFEYKTNEIQLRSDVSGKLLLASSDNLETMVALDSEKDAYILRDSQPPRHVPLDSKVLEIIIDPFGVYILIATEDGYVTMVSKDGDILWRKRDTLPLPGPIYIEAKLGSFSADGKRVSVGFRSQWHIFESKSGTSLQSMISDNEVPKLFVESQGRIITVKSNRIIYVRDVVSGKKLFELSGHKSNIEAAALNKDETILVTIDKVGGTFFWDVLSPKDSEGYEYYPTRVGGSNLKPQMVFQVEGQDEILRYKLYFDRKYVFSVNMDMKNLITENCQILALQRRFEAYDTVESLCNIDDLKQ